MAGLSRRRSWHEIKVLNGSSRRVKPAGQAAGSSSACAVSNHIRRFKRPEYIAHRDFTAISCLPDDCLLKDYPVDLPWKDGVPATAMQTSIETIEPERQAA